MITKQTTQRRMPSLLSIRRMTISILLFTTLIVHDVTLSSIPNFALAYASSHNVHHRSPNIRHISTTTSLHMGKSIKSSTKNNEGYKITIKNSKYNLIWSPNFWKKMLLSTVLIHLLSKNEHYSLNNLFPHRTIKSCHGQSSATIMLNQLQSVLPTAVVLPLLSSSCCSIQIIINAVSGFGCAGFNTYLGTLMYILYIFYVLVCLLTI